MTDLNKAIDAAREAVQELDGFKHPELADAYLAHCVGTLRDLLAALDAVQAPPDAAAPVQNPEPTRTGIASQCYDSAQLSTLPKWCRDLLAKAADALSEAPCTPSLAHTKAQSAVAAEMLSALQAAELVFREHGFTIRARGEYKQICDAIAAATQAPPAAADADEDAYVIERMGKLLAEIAIIVNGTEPHDTLWSYHDLPEKVRALKQAPPAAAVDSHQSVASDYSANAAVPEIQDEPSEEGVVDWPEHEREKAWAQGWNACRAAMLAALAERKGVES